jgi:hypothetical protein
MAKFNGASTTNFGGNVVNNAFSPTIFSQRVLNFFRTASVVEGITNNDYYGELGSYGDTVKVILEPTITVSAYTRGATVTSTALPANEMTLEISQANRFQFQVDDIEVKLSHVNWEAMATSSATYTLKNEYDKEVLTYMTTVAKSGNYLGDAATANGVIDTFTTAALAGAAPVLAGFGGGVAVDPLNILSRLALVLDENEVPEEGRYVVVTPRFMELLARTDSKLLSTDYNQGEGGLKNGLAMSGKLRGFSIYKTNNCPKFSASVDFIIAGHMSAVATVSSIDKVEKIRSETTFADIIRGLHVYGRGVVRAEALAVAAVRYS